MAGNMGKEEKRRKGKTMGKEEDERDGQVREKEEETGITR